MITDRTLYAYEQFCENYENYSVVNKAYLTRRGVEVPLNTSSPKYKQYYDYIEQQNEDYDNGKLSNHWNRVYKIGSTDYLSGKGRALFISTPDRIKQKIRMKRDPEYRARRLKEISERKEKNRAAHELGQQRAKERAEKAANPKNNIENMETPKKQSFLSQVVQAHKKHGKIISDNLRMMKDGITGR